MKIAEFCEAYKANEINLLDLISVKKYISIEDKIQMAKNIIDFAVEYERGFVYLNNMKKHFAFIFNVIEAHTDLKFEDGWTDKMHEYDILCENNLLDVIVSAFSNDYIASKEILDIMCEDVVAKNSIEASIAKLTQSVSENLDVFVGALADKLEDLDIEKIIPNDLDLDKLKGLLNNFK